MQDRITGHDIHAFKVAHLGKKPEPCFTELGYGPYHDVLARLVNQVTANEEMQAQHREKYEFASAHTLESIQEGIRISLGEILSDRIQDVPHIGDDSDELTQRQWNELCHFRAHGYLTWLQPLLDQKREETR